MGDQPTRRAIEPAPTSRREIIVRCVLLFVLMTAAWAGLEHDWVVGVVTGAILAAIVYGPDYYKHYW